MIATKSLVPFIAAAVAVAVALSAGGVAHASPPKLLVLKSEGGDAKARAKVDGTLLRLAQTAALISGREQVMPGEISFGDAVVGVGCKPELAECLDEVIGMLGVDELLTASVTAKFGVLEVVVRRIVKGGVSREATATISVDRPEDLYAVATLFRPLPTHPETDLFAHEGEPGAPRPEAAPAPAPAAQPAPRSPIETPAPRASRDGRDYDDDAGHPRRGWHIAGIAAGGGMMVLGTVLWGQVRGIQRELDTAPAPRSPADFDHLSELERRGAARATGGNLLFVGGLALTTASTYLFVRGRHAARRARTTTTTTSIAPARFGANGAGLVLTIGAAP